MSSFGARFGRAERRTPAFGQLVQHVFAGGRVEQELGAEAFALQEALQEAEQDERTRGLHVDDAIAPVRRGPHLDPDRIASADRDQFSAQRVVQAYLTHGLRLHLPRGSAVKI